MQNIHAPDSISLTDIGDNDYCFSPCNFRRVSIKRQLQKTLEFFLEANTPYDQGIEPGGVAYVNRSPVYFLRNSCINSIDITHLPNKLICLNPRHEFSDMLKDQDVLLCKDANIGDACLFLRPKEGICVFSSGIVKLNFRLPEYKYFCLALLKDSYFLEQLDCKAPKGSTIRHAGEKFLECYLPLPKPSEEWIFPVLENIVKNIAYSEFICYDRMVKSVSIFDSELMTTEEDYQFPSISLIAKEQRVDAGIYSREVQHFYHNIKAYNQGSTGLQEYGFGIKRGPNFQKRDLGRSIKSETYKRNFNIYAYPSDISDGGYLEQTSYIGARNPVWFVENKNILFSAEGTVGKTFVICDQAMRFTTNIHGMIIYPKDNDISLSKSILVGMFLNYMRMKGIFHKLSVGGQGGSFAVGYWDKILIPNIRQAILDQLCSLYHSPISMNPLDFNENALGRAGIFELNNFRIICKSLLRSLIDDLKGDKLKNRDDYFQIVQSFTT